MSDLTQFESFNKLYRLKRGILITEKIDGTNAQICIDDEGTVRAGSRNRWITPSDDNYGFARWVSEHEEELRGLGRGRHFGEWWGAGIQRRYNLTEKRFSLFNANRWGTAPALACCHVVPVLYQGPWSDVAIAECLERLRTEGSVAAPGFMQPEGIVIFHAPSGTGYKVTLDGDGHKGEKVAA